MTLLPQRVTAARRRPLFLEGDDSSQPTFRANPWVPVHAGVTDVRTPDDRCCDRRYACPGTVHTLTRGPHVTTTPLRITLAAAPIIGRVNGAGCEQRYGYGATAARESIRSTFASRCAS